MTCSILDVMLLTSTLLALTIVNVSILLQTQDRSFMSGSHQGTVLFRRMLIESADADDDTP